MGCGFDKEIIQRYADDTIDPLEFVFLREHISYCGECRKELELVMTLENELHKFFDDDLETRELDLLLNKLVDDCMHNIDKKKKLMYAVGRSMEIGSCIVGHSLKFAKYIPGSKNVRKAAGKAASAAGNMLMSIVRKKVGKLLDNDIIISFGE